MALFDNMEITDAGRELMASLLLESGEKLVLSSIAVGDGVISASETVSQRQALKHEVKRLPLESLSQEGASLKLSARLASDSLSEGLTHRELGIYATYLGKDVLVAYANAGDKYDYIPAAGTAGVIYKLIEAELILSAITPTWRELPTGHFVTHAALDSRLGTMIPSLVDDATKNAAKVDSANVFSQPQVFNSGVSLNNGANAPTGKVTAQNLYDVTKLVTTADIVLPILATDAPVDVLTFTAPSNGVYKVLACIYASSKTADSVAGAGDNRLVASLVRWTGTGNLYRPVTNALITRFKPDAPYPSYPYWESYLGTADNVRNYPYYGSKMSSLWEVPYYISFKVETMKLLAGDKLYLRGNGYSTADNVACMRALSGSFLHVTKLI